MTTKTRPFPSVAKTANRALTTQIAKRNPCNVGDNLKLDSSWERVESRQGVFDSSVAFIRYMFVTNEILQPSVLIRKRTTHVKLVAMGITYADTLLNNLYSLSEKV